VKTKAIKILYLKVVSSEDVPREKAKVTVKNNCVGILLAKNC